MMLKEPLLILQDWVIVELDKVLTNISNAEENLKTLSKHFDDSVDDDDIPF